MATVIRRNVRATPHRTGAETWMFICELLTKKGTAARSELESVAGIAEQLVCSESPRYAPIVVYGTGPRIRIYCLYDEDALTGDDANEDSLSFDPTDGEWKMSIPAEGDDVSWASAEFKKHSAKTVAREKSEPLDEDEDKPQAQTAPAVNLGAFLRP
jgi:hypothetical protein